jgi:hypothetical protein
MIVVRVGTARDSVNFARIGEATVETAVDVEAAIFDLVDLIDAVSDADGIVFSSIVGRPFTVEVDGFRIDIPRVPKTLLAVLRRVEGFGRIVVSP